MSNLIVPNFLSHYYQASHSPFVNLSDLPLSNAEAVLEYIRQGSERRFTGQRKSDYLVIWRSPEERVPKLFIARSGRPRWERPHYTFPALVAQFALPQEWNAEGKLDPECYIEAQVWANEPVQLYLRVTGV